MQSAAFQQLAAAKTALATNNQLPLAKASLLASLLKPDPVSVPREEVVQFHIFLNSCLVICSPSNIQICKRWILRNLSSPGRIQALAKYLIALGSSYSTPTKDGDQSGATPPMKPSARRRRLHILYLIHDLLHHARYNEPNPAIGEALKPFLPTLFEMTVYPGAVKQKRRVEQLLNLWDEKEIFDRAYLETLRIKVFETISETTVEDAGGADKRFDEKKSTPTANKPKKLTLPLQHGDSAVPFYELPAANMIPHIKLNTTQPINARNVKPIQFPSQNPSQFVVTAVKDLLGSVSAMYAGEDIGKQESDAVGGTAGEDGEGYYGWSKTFCEKMKRKRKEASGGNRGRSGERSPGRYGRSRSRSNSADSRDFERARPRFGSSSRSRSRSRTASRSRSPSRTPPPKTTTHNRVPPPQFTSNPKFAPPPQFPPPQQFNTPPGNQSSGPPPSFNKPGNNNSGPTPPPPPPQLPPGFPPFDLASLQNFQNLQQNIQNLQKNMGIPPPPFAMGAPGENGFPAWPLPPMPPNMLPGNMMQGNLPTLPGGLPFPFPGLPIPPPPMPQQQQQQQQHQHQQQQQQQQQSPNQQPNYDPRRDPRAQSSNAQQPWQPPYQMTQNQQGWKK